MQERRKHRRRPVSYYIQVMDAKTQQTLGHLMDITARGLMIDSKQPFPIGKQFYLRLNTAAEISNIGFVEFTARSRWCRSDVIEPRLYDIGFEIVNIAPHHAEGVRHMVERYGAPDVRTLNL